MKIEIWYDSELSETAVAVDGNRQTDMYGFMYDVHSCPLEEWLNPNGTWLGLQDELLLLARGNPITLVFYGKEDDFTKVKQALSEMEKLELRYEAWESSAGDLVSKIYELTAKLWGKFPIKEFPIATPEEAPGKINLREAGDALRERRAIYPYLREIGERCAKKDQICDECHALINREQRNALSEEDTQRKEHLTKEIGWIYSISCCDEYKLLCKSVAEWEAR